MALPGGRLAFERAIRRSGLPAPARHVALTIATWADVGTGLIPERFQPSLSTIAEATGMGSTTVKKHLTVLEAAGWLLRERPEISRARAEHARTQYALVVPSHAQGHGPETTMPRSGGDHAMDASGPSHGPEPTKAWPAAGHKSPLSTDESPGSTPSSPGEPAVDDPLTEVEATDGGGGGGDPDLRSTAQHITASLDYRGQTPDKQQRQTIEGRLHAALVAGWTMDGLAVYLDLGDAAVRSAAAVYAHRLKPGVLPDASAPAAVPTPGGGVRGPMPTAEEYASLTLEDVLGPGTAAPAGSWQQASQRARQCLTVGAPSGTDARVAGWMQLSQQLAAREPHKPYSNDPWARPADPVAAAAIPHCGHFDCDPVSRMRDGRDDNDLPFVYPCEKCHPSMQW